MRLVPWYPLWSTAGLSRSEGISPGRLPVSDTILMRRTGGPMRCVSTSLTRGRSRIRFRSCGTSTKPRTRRWSGWASAPPRDDLATTQSDDALRKIITCLKVVFSLFPAARVTLRAMGYAAAQAHDPETVLQVEDIHLVPELARSAQRIHQAALLYLVPPGLGPQRHIHQPRAAPTTIPRHVGARQLR